MIERPLGNYERYSLSRTLVGMPPVLSFVASLPTAPDRSAILHAITTLLKRHPLLSSTIQDVRTTAPRFISRDVAPEEVLKVDDGSASGTVEEALLAGLSEGEKIDVEKGPLWRVLYLPSRGEGGGKAKLVLVVNHTVSDGVGTKALLAELLQLGFSPKTAAANESVVPALPVSMEASIDVRPPILLLVREVFLELILPHLPAFLQPSPSAPIYPSPALVTPHNQPTALRLATFPSSLIVSLKCAGTAHDVPTIHPVLHTCLLAALVYSSSALPGPHSFTLGTAISLRDATLHPTATGNYVASLWSSHTSPSPSSDFWVLAREYARRLVDPRERAWAKGAMGMMAYIPDGLEEGGTGWEAFLRKKMAAENPWTATAGLSNLGVVKMPLEGIEVAWAQAAPAVGCFEVNVRTSMLTGLQRGTSYSRSNLTR